MADLSHNNNHHHLLLLQQQQQQKQQQNNVQEPSQDEEEEEEEQHHYHESGGNNHQVQVPSPSVRALVSQDLALRENGNGIVSNGAAAAAAGGGFLQQHVSVSKPVARIENNRTATALVRYRECQRNHAASIGAHAVDGCGEFMPAGEDGTPEALKCQVCNCHRNFHRQETEGVSNNNNDVPLVASSPWYLERKPQGPLLYQAVVPATAASSSGPDSPSPTPSNLLHPPFSELRSAQMLVSMADASRSRGSSSKKRFRTKFTAEQKEKMQNFADRLGWRIQKQDESAVQQFCNEVGVKRHVLKVWMHNNKHTLGKKS
eukprot:TRINITY_DN3862_c0_g1_i1.p1 TRINITY_DN3862_c0_g1~~TRINITY_DN3862_c0_g1_i1.p1  ORF type:complete len:317 (+),score=44.92 TRINITY_DN3862_c0_g1_i1:292-1242(+)